MCRSGSFYVVLKHLWDVLLNVCRKEKIENSPSMRFHAGERQLPFGASLTVSTILDFESSLSQTEALPLKIQLLLLLFVITWCVWVCERCNCVGNGCKGCRRLRADSVTALNAQSLRSMSERARLKLVMWPKSYFCSVFVQRGCWILQTYHLIRIALVLLFLLLFLSILFAVKLQRHIHKTGHCVWGMVRVSVGTRQICTLHLLQPNPQ